MPGLLTGDRLCFKHVVHHARGEKGRGFLRRGYYGRDIDLSSVLVSAAAALGPGVLGFFFVLDL
jgi:hypothetical protein